MHQSEQEIKYHYMAFKYTNINTVHMGVYTIQYTLCIIWLMVHRISIRGRGKKGKGERKKERGKKGKEKKGKEKNKSQCWDRTRDLLATLQLLSYTAT